MLRIKEDKYTKRNDEYYTLGHKINKQEVIAQYLADVTYLAEKTNQRKKELDNRLIKYADKVQKKLDELNSL